MAALGLPTVTPFRIATLACRCAFHVTDLLFRKILAR